MLKQDGRKRIMDDADLADIDYSRINEYNFADTPDHLRPQILGGYLSWSYAEAYHKAYKLTRKSISQAMYARRTLKVNPMNFSGYKNGERIPTGDNLDNIAKAVGSIVYDIVGVPRKLRDDPVFIQINDAWESLSKEERMEVLYKVNSFLENTTNNSNIESIATA